MEFDRLFVAGEPLAVRENGGAVSKSLESGSLVDLHTVDAVALGRPLRSGSATWASYES
ncbi:hypothetical protein ADILRU_0847 [Leifsonia rubra CMS 76R]|nr:hypothetical protein ADILRU_0847 [Leifsonia rubra CMS 76R]